MVSTMVLNLRSGGTITLNKDDVHTISGNNDKGSIVTVRQDGKLIAYQVYESVGRVRTLLAKS